MSGIHLRKRIDEAKKAAAEAGGAIEQTKRVYGTRLLFAGVVWGSVYLLSRGLLELSTITDADVRVLIALAPIPFFIRFLWIWMKGLGSMDELQRRIELEALAFAFPITVVILMTLGLIELATPLNKEDWSYRHVWALMPALYYAGLWRAKRRYE
jgi:hypothetical protein